MMKREDVKVRTAAAFAVIGVAASAALLVFLLAHVTLVIHSTAVRAARNDRAIEGIIDTIGGCRAWKDGSYSGDQTPSIRELESRTITLLQVLHANGLTETGKWPEHAWSLVWSIGDREESDDDPDLVFYDWIPDAITLSDAISFGGITIHGSGEVEYPGDVSEAAKEFWETVIEAFPDINWGP